MARLPFSWHFPSVHKILSFLPFSNAVAPRGVRQRLPLPLVLQFPLYLRSVPPCLSFPLAEASFDMFVISYVFCLKPFLDIDFRLTIMTTPTNLFQRWRFREVFLFFLNHRPLCGSHGPQRSCLLIRVNTAEHAAFHSLSFWFLRFALQPNPMTDRSCSTFSSSIQATSRARFSS